MLTKIQARVVAFFSRPAVQSVIRHAVTAAVAVAVPVFLAGGWPALVSGVTAAAVLRAVWAVLRPALSSEVSQVAQDGTAPLTGAQASPSNPSVQ